MRPCLFHGVDAVGAEAWIVQLEAELGAAWKAKTNHDEPREYLSVQLDDPSFPEPIRAALFEEDGAAFLVWSRRNA